MGEIIYEALAQYITIFFFVVMVLPAVIIFCGYLIYIVVMCSGKTAVLRKVQRYGLSAGRLDVRLLRAT